MVDLKLIHEKLQKELDEYKNAKLACAIIGRSGTGKSSLINAIVGEEVVETGVVESTMREQKIDHKGLSISDLPGCGTEKFPRESYMTQFDIDRFDCVILVTSDRFYEDDLFLIDELSKIKKPVYAVRTKIDFSVDREKRKGKTEEETLEVIYNDLKSRLEGYRVKGIYLTSADYPQEYDLDKLLQDVTKSVTDLKRQAFLRTISITSEEVLKEKRVLAEKVASKYAGLSAVNGLNPVPGVDVAVDAGILLKMFNDIQEIYGLNKEDQEFTQKIIGADSWKAIGGKLAQYTLKYGGKEAIMILLKRLGTSMTGKEISKWIPFVGQAIAATIGYKMTSSIASDMIDDSEQIAREIFNTIKNKA